MIKDDVTFHNSISWHSHHLFLCTIFALSALPPRVYVAVHSHYSSFRFLALLRASVQPKTMPAPKYNAEYQCKKVNLNESNNQLKGPGWHFVLLELLAHLQELDWVICDDPVQFPPYAPVHGFLVVDCPRV